MRKLKKLAPPTSNLRLLSFRGTLQRLSVALLTLVMTLTAQTAWAQGVTEIEVSSWDDLKTNAATVTTEEGVTTVKLNSCVKTTAMLWIQETVTLDLNGYGIRQTTNSSVIQIGDTGHDDKLTLIDSRQEHTYYITLTDGVGSAVNSTGTESASCIKVSGGYITGGVGISGGGIFISEAGTLIMNGGTICGNKNFIDGQYRGGGGVHVFGKFYMLAGTIKNNTAPASLIYANVDKLQAGSFYLYSGCTITNSCIPTAILSTVTDSSSDTHGEISISDASLTLLGTDYYCSGETVTVSSSPKTNYRTSTVSVTKSGDSSTSVDVSGTGNTRTFTMPAYNVDVSATYEYYVIEISNYSGLKSAFSNGGDYRLTTDFNLTTSAVASLSTNKTMSIDLNGHTIAYATNKAESVIEINKGVNLTLTDSSEGKTGKIDGGTIRRGVKISGGGLTLNGGTITGKADCGGGVYLNSGRFTMKGGKITGCTSTVDATSQGGGGVYVSGGTFTMNGGEISGNSAVRGGGVFVAGAATFTMNGGTITSNTVTTSGGGVYANNSSTFKVSGSPVVKGNLKGETANDINLGKSSSGKFAYLTITDALTEDAALWLANGSDFDYIAKRSGTSVTLTNIEAAAFRSSDGTKVGNKKSASQINLVAQQAAKPTFSPAGGTFIAAQSVTISCTTAGATIYYTTDGTDPTTSSTQYSAAIPVAQTTTIKAIAIKEGLPNSAIATATYTITGKTQATVSISGDGVSNGAKTVTYGTNPFTLTASANPAGTNGAWTWTSSDEGVATVDNTGKVTVKAASDEPVMITASYTSDTSFGSAAISLTVNKATPTYTVPTGLTATFGQILADVELPDNWAWDDDSQLVGAVGTNSFSATFTPDNTDNYNNVTTNVSVTVSFDADHFADNGDGTYTIKTAKGWDAFCDLLAADGGKTYFSGKTVKLSTDIGTADEPITRMAGASHHDFTGTFDGQGHTLTVSYNTNEQYAAPFRNAENGCVIENLHVAGTIATSAQNAAGVIANQFGTVTIRNCRVSVTISSSKSGDGTHGGFVGIKGNSDATKLTIEDCVFDGKIVSTGSDATTDCGGFVGWRKSKGSLTIKNCLYAPQTDANAVSTGATFARNGGTITNCYYTQMLGDEQGAKADYLLSETATVPSTLSGTVVFRREFKGGKASTICLPFAYTPDANEGTYYSFAGIEKVNGIYVATMAAANTAGSPLTANTPYVFMPNENVSYVPVLYHGTADYDANALTATSGNWTFKGTYSPLAYKANGTANLTGHVYGFASKTKYVDGEGEVQAGEFVHAKDGASVPPMRCYLTYKNGSQFAGTRGMTRGDDDDMPQTITVRFVNSRGEVTAIGTLNTHTGEIVTDGWYTLNGTRLNGKPSKRGIYINNGRKIVIK